MCVSSILSAKRAGWGGRKINKKTVKIKRRFSRNDAKKKNHEMNVDSMIGHTPRVNYYESALYLKPHFFPLSFVPES